MINANNNAITWLVIKDSTCCSRYMSKYKASAVKNILRNIISLTTILNFIPNI